MSKKKKPSGGNAVIYARFSSHNQKEVSIEQQFDACEKFAKENNLTIVNRYADKAMSGKTDNRPSFQRMMRDAHDGSFDYVVAWKSNRMGRNMLQAMVNESKLSELGIRCLYVEEDFEDTAAGRFALRNMMNVNQFYSENMAEDIMRGLMDNANKCKVNGRVPFGYKKGEDGKYAIDEPSASVVREIYSRLLEGWSISEIKDDLNARKIKTRNGNEWRYSSFEKLLQNEQYIGVYKYSNVRIEGGMPAIIDKETFDSVQNILTNKVRARGQPRNHIKYMLTGKVFCGECGSPMAGMSAINSYGTRFEYYACNRRRYEHSCDKKPVSREMLEDAVIEIINTELLSDAFIDEILTGYKEAAEKMTDNSLLIALQDELKDVNTRLSNILKAIEAGIFNESTQSRMEELSARRKELEKEICQVERENTIPTIDAVREWLYSLRSGNIQDREYQKKLIQIFIHAIYVYDDHLRVLFNYGKETSRKTGNELFASTSPDSTSVVTRKLFFTKDYFELYIPFNRE